MNGILIVDKPKDYTSRDVINILNKELNTKKIGHTGTLDPIATGVLVVCIGKALKLSELLVNETKEYIATVKLGIETDTLDITGNITKEKEVSNITLEMIKDTLNKFKGKLKQTVPKYSAISVNGKRLYEYARNNEEVKLPEREVEIFNIELISNLENNTFTFKCLVSKGTYIRSLIRDIGLSLDNYATMTELRRVKQGTFTIDDSYTLEDIKNNKHKLISIEEAVDLPRITVDKELEFKIKNGQVLKKFFEDDMAMIFNENKELLAIYKKKDKYYCKPYKMF